MDNWSLGAPAERHIFRRYRLRTPRRAGGGDRAGVDADVALDDHLGGGLLARRHEGDGGGGEESESELGLRGARRGYTVAR